jgi:chemotaxis protein CheX
MFDVNFINPFLGATLHVLKVQAQVVAEPGKLTVNKLENPLKSDICGVIDIKSENFKGRVAICFPQNTFLKVMSKMLGEEYSTLTPEITDGAAELANIIFGQAKITLNERGYGLQMSLPQMMAGNDHALRPKTNEKSVIVPFRSDVGEFFVVITTDEGN